MKLIDVFKGCCEKTVEEQVWIRETLGCYFSSLSREDSGSDQGSSEKGGERGQIQEVF